MESDILISTFHQWTLTELNPAASSVVALMAPLVHQPRIFCSFYLAWLVVSLNLLQHLMQNTHVPKNTWLLHVTTMLTHYFDYVYYRLQVMVLKRRKKSAKRSTGGIHDPPTASRCGWRKYTCDMWTLHVANFGSPIILIHEVGWWCTYPSEKYEFVSWDDDIPSIWKNKNHVPNHQPVLIHEVNICPRITTYHNRLWAFTSHMKIGMEQGNTHTHDPSLSKCWRNGVGGPWNMRKQWHDPRNIE